MECLWVWTLAESQQPRAPKSGSKNRWGTVAYQMLAVSTLITLAGIAGGMPPWVFKMTFDIHIITLKELKSSNK